MPEGKRKQTDQRDDDDRRRVYDIDHFSTTESEMRNFKERRSGNERRSGWMRVGKWVSVFLKALGFPKSDN